MHLTTAQIATYHERGYLCPLEGFSPAEAVRNRQAFDDLLARFRRDGQDTYAINGYHTSCRSIWYTDTCPPQCSTPVETA